MEKEEVKRIAQEATKVECFEVMATKAFHLMGDISSESFDLACIGSETEKYYVGNWVFGMGFFDVVFPKETSRALTNEELKKYNASSVQISNNPPIPLQVNNRI